MSKRPLKAIQTNRAEQGARLRNACIEAADCSEPLVFAEGFDEAILGVAERDGEMCVVYEKSKIIRTLRRRDGMDKDGAIEFFEYNIAGACGAPGTQMFISVIC